MGRYAAAAACAFRVFVSMRSFPKGLFVLQYPGIFTMRPSPIFEYAQRSPGILGLANHLNRFSVLRWARDHALFMEIARACPIIQAVGVMRAFPTFQPLRRAQPITQITNEETNESGN
jgi:hypothetical protein